MRRATSIAPEEIARNAKSANEPVLGNWPKLERRPDWKAHRKDLPRLSDSTSVLSGMDLMDEMD